MSGDMNVISRTQQIFVEPASSSVSVVNAGPPGPASGSPIELLYAQGVANVPVTATAEAAPTMVLNPANNLYYDGSPILIQFFSMMAYPASVAGGMLIVTLWDGNTDLGRIAQMICPAANQYAAPINAFRRFSPSPGNHNYNVRAWVVGGNGQIGGGNGGAGSQLPMFIRITKV